MLSLNTNKVNTDIIWWPVVGHDDLVIVQKNEHVYMCKITPTK